MPSCALQLRTNASQIRFGFRVLSCAFQRRDSIEIVGAGAVRSLDSRDFACEALEFCLVFFPERVFSQNEPQADVVDGYPHTMPTFAGQLSERDIDGIIEFIKAQK